LRFTGVGLADFQYRALKSLARFNVANGNQLAARDFLGQKNQRAMSIDDGGKGLLGESVSIGPITGNDDSNGKHDAVAAALIRISLLAHGNESHKSSPCSPVRGLRASFNVISRSNLRAKAR
jgi:hypothetical protein